MKPATVAPRPRPKLPATRRSAVDAARCSAGTRVKGRTWPAVRTNPKPAPPTAEQTKPCPETAVIAVDDNGEIVGSLIATAHRHVQARVLGEDGGTIGSVGAP